VDYISFVEMKNRFTSLDEEGFSTAGGDDKFRTPQTLQPALEVLVRKKRCAWEHGEEIVTHQQVGNPLRFSGRLVHKARNKGEFISQGIAVRSVF